MPGLAAARSNAPAASRADSRVDSRAAGPAPGRPAAPVRLGATRSASRPSPQWRTAARYRLSSAARGPR